MSTFPTNPALEAAIVAYADEDTPRLAYADWLDENSDPDRAEFIRVQCRLAEMSPAESDWVDLIEQQDELAARLKHRHLSLAPDTPDRFHFRNHITGNYEEIGEDCEYREHFDKHESFRRGFPHFISCRVYGEQWTAKETARVAAKLTRLVRTTTIRGFEPYTIPTQRLAELLAAPAAAALTGLALNSSFTGYTNDWDETLTDFYRLVATSPALRRVRQLFLYGAYGPVGVATLAKAESLAAVRRMTIRQLVAPKAALGKLIGADWFGRLRHFRTHLHDGQVAESVIRGLGRLPDLHTLDLPEFLSEGRLVRDRLARDALAVLAAGKFRSLARIVYKGSLNPRLARLLTHARFPELVVFDVPGEMENDTLLELLKADWFARLRVLNFTDSVLGDTAVAALTAHPVTKNLRVLRLADHMFGNTSTFAKSGLMRLAKSALPELTTLDLCAHSTRKVTGDELARFVFTLQLPQLRHLNLSGWPLGDAGANALAASRAFAGLTRLNLENCGISNRGAKALFASPHLQNLVELQLGANGIKTAADALADPAVMPRLGACGLSYNKIPTKAAAKLKWLAQQRALHIVT